MTFHPATPERWPDIERLFGERGACGGCWCMAWRLPRRKWEDGKGAKNKRAFKKIITSGETPGIVAYIGDEPIAWCAVAPRAVYSVLERSRVLKPVDDQPVWSVSCLFILKPYRRRGVSTRLLKAATRFAKSQGAKILEGYPIEPAMERTPDPFIWTGTPSAFLKAGFKEVARRSRTRPIMRYVLRSR
ncbi:MAG: GNAT family N-acetyltransferase [Candidatus Latescibacterota bacterium]|nr:MAG: GNAT family N-acetyltransferase [Candidatus Latescibacterota bacterium]